MPFDSNINFILEKAIVPEHSPELMRSLSTGEPLAIGPWVFYAASDWIMGIGYPLYDDNSSFSEALEEARAKTGAVRVFAMAPSFPKNLSAYIREEDRYYALSPRAKIPGRLLNVCERAASKLTVEFSSDFKAGHRKLWGEFVARNAGRMNDRVRELVARTPLAMAEGNLLSLDARDDKGNLAASLLIDTRPANFISYIIGAHSTENYVPGASDLLFSRLIELARAENRKFIHLG
ncbi:MAG: GNAT family N-acetyltransferase, partial [Desulfovibrio sp.]|nr:GNAT family N-acetyltransferase [Desulfovibrio sp.]